MQPFTCFKNFFLSHT